MQKFTFGMGVMPYIYIYTSFGDRMLVVYLLISKKLKATNQCNDQCEYIQLVYINPMSYASMGTLECKEMNIIS